MSPREERAVFSAALHRVFTEEPEFASVQVVRTTHAPNKDARETEQRLRIRQADELAGLKDETIRSFLERNRDVDTLPEPLVPGMPYSWVSAEDFLSEKVRAYRRADGKLARLAVLSAAGFDRGRTQALVWVADACGLCGHAEYVLLARTPLGWVITAQSDDWWS